MQRNVIVYFVAAVLTDTWRLCSRLYMCVCVCVTIRMSLDRYILHLA